MNKESIMIRNENRTIEEVRRKAREAQQKRYSKMPERAARIAIREYKENKKALKEGEDANKLLDDLVIRIRVIFGEK